MPNNKPHRKICVLNAGRDAVQVLEKQGILCALVGPLAAYVHGSTKVPVDATLMASGGTATQTIDDVTRILVEEPGEKFRRNGSTLTYYDPTAEESDVNKRKKCKIDLRFVPSDQRPPGFRREDLQRITDLPVASVLCLTFDMSISALELYHRRSAAGIVGQNWLPKGRVQTIEALLTPSNTKSPMPIRSNTFNQQAIEVLTELSGISPTLARRLHPLIKLCQNQLELGDSTTMDEKALPNEFDESGDPPVNKDSQTIHIDRQQNPKPDTTSLAFEHRLRFLGNTTNVTNKKQRRRVCIVNAAYDVIEILDELGIECILVDKLAAHLYGSAKIPTTVSIILLPQDDGIAHPAYVVSQLLRSSPDLFQKKASKGVGASVKYLDPTAKENDPPNRRSCTVTIAQMQDSASAWYMEARQRIHGLPVVGVLPLLLEYAHLDLRAYARRQERAQTSGNALKLTKALRGMKILRLLILRLLQALKGRQLQAVRDPSFNKQAITAFEALSEISGNPHFLRLISFCEAQLKGSGGNGTEPSTLDGKDVVSTSAGESMQQFVLDGKDGKIDDDDDDSDDDQGYV